LKKRKVPISHQRRRNITQEGNRQIKRGEEEEEEEENDGVWGGIGFVGRE
jgi:hypothetical protein